MPASEAEKKFWNCPWLVEELIANLDINSLALLLEAHKPIIDILTEGSVTWNNLIRRIVAGWVEEKDFMRLQTRSELGNVGDIVRDSAQKKHIMDTILDLVKIIKMMTKVRQPLVLDLLDLICERFPPLQYTDWQHVKVSCPRHDSPHKMALFGSALFNTFSLFNQTGKS